MSERHACGLARIAVSSYRYPTQKASKDEDRGRVTSRPEAPSLQTECNDISRLLFSDQHKFDIVVLKTASEPHIVRLATLWLRGLITCILKLLCDRGKNYKSVRAGDSGEAERSFRREAERHSGMIPNTIGA